MTATPQEAWRDLALRALKGAGLDSLESRDADGLARRPLHTATGAIPPVFAPRGSDAEGRPWDIRTRVLGDEPDRVNQRVLADLRGGAASVLLGGAVVRDAGPLAAALADVALEAAPIGLEAGLDGPGAANALAVVAKGSPRARLVFHLDPLSDFAEHGVAPLAMEAHMSMAAATADRHAGAYPMARLFLASGRMAHEAGGSAGQELGVAAAAAVAYARSAEAAGMDARVALARTTLGLAADAEYFDGVCKLRAMRLIWSSLVKAADMDAPAVVEARSSRRMLSARDPWPNLLRLTAAGFAAAVGGADAVVLDGFTEARGEPDDFARRLSRNTQLVLMEEAQIGRVDDPAAGAWALDARTRDLAEAGWAVFRRIEAEGGLLVALRSGLVQDAVAASREVLVAEFAQGRSHRVGDSRFVDADPRPASAEPRTSEPPPAGDDACAPLTPIRLAEPFEAAA